MRRTGRREGKACGGYLKGREGRRGRRRAQAGWVGEEIVEREYARGGEQAGSTPPQSHACPTAKRQYPDGAINER